MGGERVPRNLHILTGVTERASEVWPKKAVMICMANRLRMIRNMSV